MRWIWLGQVRERHHLFSHPGIQFSRWPQNRLALILLLGETTAGCLLVTGDELELTPSSLEDGSIVLDAFPRCGILCGVCTLHFKPPRISHLVFLVRVSLAVLLQVVWTIPADGSHDGLGCGLSHTPRC